jgi:hypothetical protein
MALAFAARLALESKDRDKQIVRAFQLAYGRNPDDRELTASRQHISRMLAFHQSTPPAPKPERKPLVHKITSELTGESFEFVQQEDPVPYEENLSESQASPEVRALGDFALALFNSNEFVYLY